MPELPEVENVRLTLIPVLEGARIEKVSVRRPDLRFPFPERFAERLRGQTISSIGRRAKYLLWHLGSGETLIVHLGMSGRLLVSGPAPESQPRASRGVIAGAYVYESGDLPQHDHVVIELANGATLIYNDPRRFGFMILACRDSLPDHPLFRHLGIEPLGLDLTPESLARSASGRRSDLKSFLMDQRHIAGLGNIYVAEALFRAQISPIRKAASLARGDGRPTGRAERLVPAIRSVITEAVAAGGSTLRDYVKADGSRGAFQNAHAVYGREGQMCIRPGCGGTVRRLVQGARSTFYCPSCQR